jgi:uncharacterized damage-inducible protein DinB
MKSHFLKFLAYEQWANEKIIDSLGMTKYPSEKGLELLNHILAAQNNWLCRLRNENSYLALWEKKDLWESSQLLRKTTQNLVSFVESLSEDDFTKTIAYVTSEGIEYSSTIQEILTHLMNHSTYHRGQIVFNLKGQIPEMPVTDFIAFVR